MLSIKQKKPPPLLFLRDNIKIEYQPNSKLKYMSLLDKDRLYFKFRIEGTSYKN